MTVEVTLLIAFASLMFSAYFGLRNNKRSDTKELEQRVKERTETNMKLDEISRNVADIKDAFNELRRNVKDLEKRISTVEDKADKAHLRIDILEGKDISTE